MRKFRNLLLASVFGVIMVSCTVGPTSISSSGHHVEKSIEGGYVVRFETETVGHLNLSDSQYSFTVTEGIQIPSAANHPFFIDHPAGSYNIEYYGLVTSDDLLESLEHRAGRAILAYIRFSNDQIGSLPSTSTLPTRYLFAAVSDKEERTVNLSSVDAEAPPWFIIVKPWD